MLGFDSADVSRNIMTFSDVKKRFGVRLDEDEFYEKFQEIYDNTVSIAVGEEKAENSML